jgi:predicted AAA+ superfamily ATPase
VIARPDLDQRVRSALRESPVVALLGPRQCGKTTLARRFAGDRREAFFDLEDAVDRVRLEAPQRALGALRGLVVIDEIQRLPGLFEVLRVLADRRPRRARFLVLGSASPELVRGASETLAGRVRWLEMGGFDVTEVGVERWRRLWWRGAFPRSFLARTESESLAWRDSFIASYLERDVPQLGLRIPSATLRRFWTMVAHYHGGIWNAAEFARSLGTSEPTARRYLDVLCGSFVVRALTPWFENIGKRQVKAPKVYVRDSGLLHALLSVGPAARLDAHPKHGASFEGFVVEELARLLGRTELHYWATHGGAELDVFAIHRGRRLGFEVKTSDAPAVTASMRSAISTLRLDALRIVYPGDRPYDLADDIRVVPVSHLPGELGARPLARGAGG